MLSAVIFSSQQPAKKDKTKIDMSRLDEKGMPSLNKHLNHHKPKATRTDGRNLRQDCPDRDKPCETLQTVQRAGRGGKVDIIFQNQQGPKLCLGALAALSHTG